MVIKESNCQNYSYTVSYGGWSVMWGTSQKVDMWSLLFSSKLDGRRGWVALSMEVSLGTQSREEISNGVERL